MKKYKKVILDYGHGGMLLGEYQTAGKRSPEYNGQVYYEGVGNRTIGHIVERYLNEWNIPYLVACDPQLDTPLSARTDIANAYDTEENDVFLVSIHSNAGGGTGCEWHHYPNSDNGIDIANVFYHEYNKVFARLIHEGYKNRGLKASNFQILRDTTMPAVLLELFFMDNIRDCTNILMKEHMIDKIGIFIANTIYSIVNTGVGE